MPSDLATRLSLLSADLFEVFLFMAIPWRLRCRSAAIHEYNVAFGRPFGDGLDRRASRLLYAFKKGIPEGCVDIFFGHKSPLSAPVLGVESGHFDLRKGADPPASTIPFIKTLLLAYI